MAEQPDIGRHFPVNDAFHVLLVEDDAVTLKSVQQLLRNCGYAVTTAQNGRDAIQRLESSNGTRFDLILTDIYMPGVSGYDIVRQVVHGYDKESMNIPVVVMSAEDSQHSVLQAFEAGAVDYLVKPIRRNELTTLWQHVWRANKGSTRAQALANRMTALSHLQEEDNKNSSDASTSNLDLSNVASTGISRDGSAIWQSPSLHHQAHRSNLGASSMDSDIPETTCAPNAPAVHILHRAKKEKLYHNSLNTASIRPPVAPSNGPSLQDTSMTSNTCQFEQPSCTHANKVPPARPVPDKSYFSSNSSCSGVSISMPLGLQELAALGQQRQQERDNCKPMNDIYEPCSPTALRHSDRSAFSAFTVFLPKAAALDTLRNMNGGDASSSGHETSASGELKRCGTGQTQAGSGSNPVALPDHVAHLICALSHRSLFDGSAVQDYFLRQSASIPQPSLPSGHRQAAVAKYLEKKKLRNFHKKVRYESRKRLAEARPRVRGQFVKQTGPGERLGAPDSAQETLSGCNCAQ